MLAINKCKIQTFNNRNNNKTSINVINFQVTNDAKEFSKKGSLSIPRNYIIYDKTSDKTKNFQYDIKRNDIILVFLTSENANPYREVFIVTNTIYSKKDITIEFEDFGYYLKGLNNINFTYNKRTGSAKYNDILQYVKDEFDKRVDFINDELSENIYLSTIFKVEKLEIGKNIKLFTDKYEFLNVNVAQMIDYIRENFNFYFTFDQVNLKNGLISIVPKLRRMYLEDLELKHNFNFQFNEEMYTILDYTLDYYTDKNMTIQINAKNYRNINLDVITDEYIYIYPRNFIADRSVDLIYFNLDLETFKKSVEEEAKSKTYFGWKGSITTHGPLPTRVNKEEYIKIGEVIKINNAKYFNNAENFINSEDYIEDDELYKVILTELIYDETGIRQSIDLGNRVKR